MHNNISLLFFFVFLSCHAHTLHSRESNSKNTLIFKDTTIKILWQENTCKNCQPVRRINQQYLTSAPDAQKAALGLVSTFYASVCEDAGKPTDNPRTLSCELSKALGFEFQCSEKQLIFLKHWFRNDSVLQRRLTFDSCNMRPPGSNGSNSPTSFSAITIITNKNNIEVICSLENSSIYQHLSRSWDEHLLFKFQPDNDVISLIKTTVKNSQENILLLKKENR